MDRPGPKIWNLIIKIIAEATKSLPQPLIAYVCAGSGAIKEASLKLGRERSGEYRDLKGSVAVDHLGSAQVLLEPERSYQS